MNPTEKLTESQFFENAFKDYCKKQILIFNDLYNDFISQTGLLVVSKNLFKIKLEKWLANKQFKASFSITNFGSKSMQLILIETAPKPLFSNFEVLVLAMFPLVYRMVKNKLENDFDNNKS